MFVELKEGMLVVCKGKPGLWWATNVEGEDGSKTTMLEFADRESNEHSKYGVPATEDLLTPAAAFTVQRPILKDCVWCSTPAFNKGSFTFCDAECEQAYLDKYRNGKW